MIINRIFEKVATLFGKFKYNNRHFTTVRTLTKQTQEGHKCGTPSEVRTHY